MLSRSSQLDCKNLIISTEIYTYIYIQKDEIVYNKDNSLCGNLKANFETSLDC